MNFYSFLPSGNPTILVAEPILGNRIALSKYLLSKYKVEQVGFITAVKPRLQMMGNEFCINATRAFGVWLYQQQEEQGEQEWLVEVSGCDSPVLVLVKAVADGSTFQAKVLMDTEQVICKTLALGLNLVVLPGISHLVLDIAYFPLPKAQAQATDGVLLAQVSQLLQQYDLWTLPAAGCIWVEQTRSGFELTPFVHVRDTATIYAETACGSGTLAAGLVQDMQLNLALGETLSFKQPSQEILWVQKAKAQAYWVGGEVRFLGQGQCEPVLDF